MKLRDSMIADQFHFMLDGLGQEAVGLILAVERKLETVAAPDLSWPMETGETGFQIVHNTPAHGGKYVSLGFIAERAGRLSPIAGLLCRPLNLLKNFSFYLNLRDEMVVVARQTDPQSGTS